MKASRVFDLAVRVYDPAKPNTYYITRRIPFKRELLDTAKGIRHFSLRFPQSPKKLLLELYDRDSLNDHGFTLEKMEVRPMPPRKIWAHPGIHKFLEFAESFAAKAGYLKPGFYDSPDHEFLIEVLPEITDRYGRSLRTPARINRVTGRIQVSANMFRRFTIPVRLFILLHERFHKVLNTRLEKLPDREGLRTYLEAGYPGTEALYAASKVFLEFPGSISKQAYDRVVAIGAFIDQFNRQQNKRNRYPKAA